MKWIKYQPGLVKNDQYVLISFKMSNGWWLWYQANYCKSRDEFSYHSGDEILARISGDKVTHICLVEEPADD